MLIEMVGRWWANANLFMRIVIILSFPIWFPIAMLWHLMFTFVAMGGVFILVGAALYIFYNIVMMVLE